MKRAISILAAAVLVVGAPTFAAGHRHAKPTAGRAAAGKAASKQPEARCPVMGGKVKDFKTAPKSVYKGKTYISAAPGASRGSTRNRRITSRRRRRRSKAGAGREGKRRGGIPVS